MRGIRPLQGSRFRIVAAVTVALILLGGLMFPFIAVAYAERCQRQSKTDPLAASEI